jgi:O-antigen ligase
MNAPGLWRLPRLPFRARDNAASQRRTDAIAFLLFVPLLVVAGSAATSLSSQYGALKVIWVVLAALGALVALVDLGVALCVLVFILAFPFKTQVAFGVEVHTTHLLLVTIALLTLYGFYAGRLRLPKGLLVPITMMLFGGVVASIAGPDTGPSLGRLVSGLLLPITAGLAAAAALRPRRDLRLLVIIVAVVLTGASLLALLQSTGHAPGPLAPSFEKDRVNGLFDHPNILGAYLSANILLLLGVGAYAWRRMPLAPVVFIGPIFLGIAGLAVTLSRGALVGLGAGVIAIMVLMIARRHVLPVLVVLLVIVLTVFVAIPNVPESQRASFAARFQQLTNPGAETGRSLLYHDAVSTIQQYPLTGVGPLTFGVITARTSPIPLLEKNLTHAHDIFLETYLSLGPIGFLGFLWLAAGAIRRLIRATRGAVGRTDPIVAGWATGSLGALAAMLAQGIADFVFWQLEMLTLLMLLLGAAYAIGQTLSRNGPIAARGASSD